MKSKTIKLNGNAFSYLEQGSKSGATASLLCLHGLGDSADQFEPLAERIPDTWHMIALDQRGHGGSWKPAGESYSPLDFAQDAKEFIETVGLGPAHVFGHSMGGRNGLLLAANHKNSVRSLILGDIGPEKNLDDIKGTIEFFETLPEEFETEDEARAHWRKRKPNYSDENIELLMRNLEKTTHGNLTWRFSKSACIEAIKAARSRDWWEFVSKISSPTLFFHVEGSSELSDETATHLRNELQNVKYVRVPNSGHNFHLENPDFMSREIINFFTTI